MLGLSGKADDLLRWVHRSWDSTVDRLGLGSSKPISVFTYRGFGRPDYLFLTGRVVRDRGIARGDQDTIVNNLVNNFKRFYTREIPNARVRIEWGGHIFNLVTDAEGYFHVEREFDPPVEFPKQELWQQARVVVESAPGDPEVDHTTHTDVLLPQAADFGIITDIDDTVMQTDVTSRFKLRTMYLTLLKNAASRIAFKQVTSFFHALQLGPDREGLNPFFYVSNSPWNLYDLLTDFLALNRMPKGPVLLRDFGLPYGEKPEDFRGHKITQIERIMKAYPDLPFVLVGDSGEKDADIYLTIANEFPQRVKAIYIRDVQHLRRTQRVEQLIEKMTDVPVKIVDSYTNAAEHAAGLGLIDLEDFRQLNRS